jgi:diguanylate cyclase (GGDEF)-like protein/PAS domain S-box-containing protein
MDGMPDPVVVVGPDGDLLYGNRAAWERYGAPLDELYGTPMAALIHPDDLDTALLALVSVLGKPRGGSLIEMRLRERSGEYAWFEVRGRAWDGGPDGAVVLNLREITDRRQWEITGGDTPMMAAVLDHLPVVAMLLEADGTLRGANRALTRMLQRDLEDVRGHPITDLVTVEEVDRVRGELVAAAQRSGTVRLEARLLRADGTPVPVSLSVVNLLDDQAVKGLLVTAADISRLVEARAELHRLATTDSLTGLPNRTSLRQHLQQVLHEAGPDRPHTVLFGDVDDLKSVNDHHGHRGGDAVLCEVARRIRTVLRPTDFVARLSGDEFVMVVATDEPSLLDDLRHRIGEVMAEPMTLPGDVRAVVSISLGAAPLEPTANADDLWAAADAAMYDAKRGRQP